MKGKSFQKRFSFSVDGAKSNPLEPRSPLQTFKVNSCAMQTLIERRVSFTQRILQIEWKNRRETASRTAGMMQHRVRIHKNAQINRRPSSFSVPTLDVTAGSFRKRGIPPNTDLNVKLKAHKSFLKDQ